MLESNIQNPLILCQLTWATCKEILREREREDFVFSSTFALI